MASKAKGSIAAAFGVPEPAPATVISLAGSKGKGKGKTGKGTGSKPSGKGSAAAKPKSSPKAAAPPPKDGRKGILKLKGGKVLKSSLLAKGAKACKGKKKVSWAPDVVSPPRKKRRNASPKPPLPDPAKSSEDERNPDRNPVSMKDMAAALELKWTQWEEAVAAAAEDTAEKDDKAKKAGAKGNNARSSNEDKDGDTVEEPTKTEDEQSESGDDEDMEDEDEEEETGGEEDEEEETGGEEDEEEETGGEDAANDSDADATSPSAKANAKAGPKAAAKAAAKKAEALAKATPADPLYIDAPREPDPTCRQCKCVVDVLAAGTRLMKKSPNEWVCPCCNGKITALHSLFGKWPIECYKRMPPNIQETFWRESKPGVNGMKLAVEQHLVYNQVKQFLDKRGGKFLPMDVWIAKGWTKETVLKCPSELDPILGTTYQVQIHTVEESTIQELVRKEMLQILQPKHAAEEPIVKPSAEALEDREDEKLDAPKEAPRGRSSSVARGRRKDKAQSASDSPSRGRSKSKRRSTSNSPKSRSRSKRSKNSRKRGRSSSSSSTTLPRRSKGKDSRKRSPSRGKRSPSRGKRSPSRGKRSTSRGKRSPSRGKRSPSRGNRSPSRRSERKAEEERKKREKKEAEAKRKADLALKARQKQLQSEATRIVTKLSPILMDLEQDAKHGKFTHVPKSLKHKLSKATDVVRDFHTKASDRLTGKSTEPMEFTMADVSEAAKEGIEPYSLSHTYIYIYM